MPRSHIVGTLVLAASLSLPRISLARAETTPPLTSTVVEYKPIGDKTEKRVFDLLHIRPRLMAWWLDPENVPLPPAANWPTGIGMQSAPPEEFRPDAAHLPRDIAELKIVDSQSRLIAYGTPQALDELQNVIKTLDVPLQKVECEVQVLRLADEDLRALPLLPPNFQTTTGIALGVASQAILSRFTTLAVNDKVKTLMAPRVTATSGLRVSFLTDEMSSAVVLNRVRPPGAPAPAPGRARIADVARNSIVTLYPLVRPDGSVLLTCELAIDKLNCQILGAEIRKNEVCVLRSPVDGLGKVTVALIICRVVPPDIP